MGNFSRTPRGLRIWWKIHFFLGWVCFRKIVAWPFISGEIGYRSADAFSGSVFRNTDFGAGFNGMFATAFLGMGRTLTLIRQIIQAQRSKGRS